MYQQKLDREEVDYPLNGLTVPEFGHFQSVGFNSFLSSTHYVRKSLANVWAAHSVMTNLSNVEFPSVITSSI